MRFYCPICERYVPDSGLQIKRILPDTKPPWPLFEYMDKPICSVCKEDLVDTKWVKTDLQSVFGCMPDLPINEIGKETT
jgi:hypothetical protein